MRSLIGICVFLSLMVSLKGAYDCRPLVAEKPPFRIAPPPAERELATPRTWRNENFRRP